MRALVFLAICAALTACGKATTPIPAARESGELVVLTRNGPTTYYEDAQGQHVGLEHDLATLFARDLGLNLRFVVVDRFQEILPLLAAHQAHFAAAGITMTDARRQAFQFSTPYQTVQEQLVFNRVVRAKPRGWQDVLGLRLEVVAGSSYVEHLREVQREYPKLQWIEADTLDSDGLLAKLADGDTDLVIADSHVVTLSQNFHPEIAVAFNVGRPSYLAWPFPRHGDAWLYKKSLEFFARIQRDGTLKRLLDRYYGHIERLQPADVTGILARMRTTLPMYREWFQQGQVLTGIDWRLLAALGYQESQWNPLATSPTGVRGLMMLTEQTADHLGVADRLDARESILAGSRYLLQLRDALPARIPEPDRTWMALAAYNVGFGHLEDARVLAARRGLNPDSWVDLKQTLPLLARADYYTTVKHGFARGGEAVILTENIRTYYDILVKFEKPYKPLFGERERRLALARAQPMRSAPPM